MTTPSSHASLPFETWKYVFTCVNAWPERIETMRNICLTCRTFCSLAQPLLYHTLDIRPFTKGPLLDGLRSRISLRDDVRDEVIERLSFIASDKIAPYVRNISVDFAQYGGGLREDGCNAILTSLVHRLHRFVGLQKLTFAHNLCLRPDEFILPPCASRPILPLTEYVGPRALLPLLAETPTLRTLHLISIEESGFDDCVHLMPAISCNIVSRVTHFTAKIDTLTEGTFRVILSKFSCLVRLFITVETPLFADASVVPTWINMLLQPDVSPDIQHIKIWTHPLNGVIPKIPPLEHLEHHLFQKYPSLEEVFFCNKSIWYSYTPL